MTTDSGARPTSDATSTSGARATSGATSASGTTSTSGATSTLGADSSETADVDLTVTGERLSWTALTALFQRGVTCRLAGPRSIRAFLSDDIGLALAYIDERIATVFLDGMVVDDLDATIVRPGSTLTLSAAMPGLVGASLRRGGFYAAMRSEISWSASPFATAAPISGTITVKLFNVVLREIGPFLLARGILLEAEEARGLFLDASVPLGGVPDGRKIFLTVRD